MIIEELVLKIKTDISGVKDKIQEIKKELGNTPDVAKKVEDHTKQCMEQIQSEINKAGESTKILGRNMKQSMEESTSSIREAQSSIVTHQRELENLKRKILDGEDAHRRQSDAIKETARETESLKNRLADYIKQAEYAAGIKVHSDEYKDVESNIEKTEKKLEKLIEKSQEMRELGKDLTVSKEYKEIQRAIDSARKRLNNFLATEERIKETGGRQRGANWDKLQYNIKEARNTLKAYQQDLENLVAENGHISLSKPFETLQKQIQLAQDKLASYQRQKGVLEKSGRDMVRDTGFSSGSHIRTLLATAKAGIRDLKNNIQFGLSLAKSKVADFVKRIPVIGRVATETAFVVKTAFHGMKLAISILGGAVKKTGTFFKQLGSKIKSIIPHMNSAKKGMKDVDASSKHLGKSLFRVGTLLKTMFLHTALRTMLQGAKEGFQNLARYSNNFNKSMSMLMSSMTQLKNSFATAFAPLINAVAPVLNKIIQLFVKAANSIGQFFAALTGQGFYVRAKEVQQDYASSLDKATGSAKKAKKAAEEYKKSIMGFDELNPLTKQNKNDNDSDGSSGSGASSGLSPSDMFETVPIESKFKELAEKLKAIWGEIFAPIKSAWGKEGAGVMEAWKRALDGILKVVKSIGKSFLEVWTNGTGETFCTNILKLVKEIGLAIGDVAEAFQKAWDNEGRGTALIQSYFDKWNAILELILSISESMRTVWNSGSGESIIANILEILTNIQKTIGNIATNFKKAWELDNTGTKILQNLVDIFDNLLGHINNITSSLEKWSKDLDFSPLLTAFEGVTNALKPLGDKIGSGLEWFFKNVLEPLGKWAVEQAIPAALNGIEGALKLIDTILDSLKPLGTWLWDNFLKPLGEWTGGVVVDVLNGIGTAFSTISDIIKDSDGFTDSLVNVGTYLIDGLKNGVVTGLKEIGTWIKNTIIDPIVTKVKEFFGIHSPSTVFAGIGGYLIEGLKQGITNAPSVIKDAIEGLWTTAKTWWDTNVKLPDIDFKAKIGTKWEDLKKDWDELKRNAKDLLLDVKAKIGTKWEDIKKAWGELKGNATDLLFDVKAKIGTKWDDIKNAWGSLKGNTTDLVFEIKAKIGTKWGDLKEKWGNLKKKATGKTVLFKARVGTTWASIKTKWNNLTKNIKDKTVTLKMKVISTAQGLRNAINQIIDMVNRNVIQKIKLNVPKAFQWIGGSTIGPPPDIPKFAKGGIVNKATIGMIGEAGTEAVIPLENNTGWIDNLASKINSKLNRSSSDFDYRKFYEVLVQALNSMERQDIVLHMDGTLIARQIVKNINQFNRRQYPVNVI